MLRKLVLLTAVGLLVVTGCYGGKLLKMPINADSASRDVDSLRVEQAQLRSEIRALSLELEAERKQRLKESAEGAARLSAIDEQLSILGSKLDDLTQLMVRLQRPRPAPPVAPPTSTSPDTGTSPVPDTSATSRLEQADTSRTLPEEEEELYRAAYMDLTMGNYSLALQGFRNYLVRYPAGTYLDEVHYYMGECLYATGDHLKAVGEFSAVIREFEHSRLVPAAYLKAGQCYLELEEIPLAKKQLRELISRFPHSEEAEQARVILKDLGG